MSLEERWKRQMQALRAQGRDRELKAPSGIDCSSNDYLGGGSPHASRLLGGHHPIWDEVEAGLAAWHGAEAALVINSGYAANEGLLAAIIEPGDWVASDALNHASIIDGIRLSRAAKFIYRHLDLDHLEDGLWNSVAAGANKFVVTESLFGMDGDRAPLGEIAKRCVRHQAHLIVDEAHATGCFGPQGGGLVDAAALRSRVLATVHTGGKALGVTGAYIVGSRSLRELLINRCRHLIFTTALPPAVGEAWLRAIDRVQRDDAGRERLHANARLFRDELSRLGIAALGTDYIVPIIIGDDAKAVRIATRLQARGWDIRAIRPPSVPPGTARLRVSIHADHEPAMLNELARTLGELLATP